MCIRDRSWMDEHGEPTIRRDLATAWVAQFTRRTVSERLNHIRQFAEHVAWFDPDTEIPLVDGNPYGSHRARPLIFTPEQIDALLVAAGKLTPRIRAASWQALLGLLTVTGLRISEARNLNDADITADERGQGGWVRVADTKFGKSRLVPLHQSTMTAIGRYQRLRDATFPVPKTTAVFVARRGRSACQSGHRADLLERLTRRRPGDPGAAPSDEHRRRLRDRERRISQPLISPDRGHRGLVQWDEAGLAELRVRDPHPAALTALV